MKRIIDLIIIAIISNVSTILLLNSQPIIVWERYYEPIKYFNLYMYHFTKIDDQLFLVYHGSNQNDSQKKTNPGIIIRVSSKSALEVGC